MSTTKSPRRSETRQTSAAAAKAPSAAPAEEKQVREVTERLAYELYEKRGRTDGHDLEDWLSAEKSAREQVATAKA